MIIDSLTGKPIPVYLRYWRYHSLYEDEEDNLIEACRRAISLEDEGEASIEEIEVDGMTLSGIGEIEAYYQQHHKAGSSQSQSQIARNPG